MHNAARAQFSPEYLPLSSLVFGVSQEAQSLIQRVEMVACTDVPILIQGESGTRKQCVARWIHQISSYSAGPFHRVDCSTEAADSETGDVIARLLAETRGGTLFLDDVDHLPLTAQAELSELLPDPFDSARVSSADGRQARVVSATRRDFRDGPLLRPELLYRLNAFTAFIPPVRSRGSEIAGLARHFVEIDSERMDVAPRKLSPAANDALRRYGWPGNLHEMEELLTSFVLTGDEALLIEKLTGLRRSQEAEAESPNGLAVTKAVGDAEREAILQALREHAWNRKETARDLHMSYRSLLYKIKTWGLGGPRLVSR